MRMMLIADMPDDVAKAWNQHVRDFDEARPGVCHFKIVNNAPDLSMADMMDAVKLDPPFDWLLFQKTQQRKRDVLAKISTDLEWRGPTGKAQNFVCLQREQAEALLT